MECISRSRISSGHLCNLTIHFGNLHGHDGWSGTGDFMHTMHMYTHIYMHVHISRCDNSVFVQDLASNLFGNPHSQHGWSGNEGSAQAVAEARQLTLQMCNAPLGEYECVFTSGATGVFISGATGALHSPDHSPIIAIITDQDSQPCNLNHGLTYYSV